ncbi:MAG TPA: serine hydroxymethyltransferase [Candidatus Paceibacterota bacterium]|jgi:glycine hydroxymethyltransferase|nr:serine hydroxymethyltransferase [Candidatus Paceibacterota bacterium]
MKDTQIKKLIDTEKKRQKKVINLIASENYVSKDVLEALGSELTNKYAEGYPGKRYYGGNEIVDKIESLCIERALKLFKLDPTEWHVNVQALSGSPANLAVYTALIPPKRIVLPGAGEAEVLVPSKIMGMSLDHGGHLTHGHKVSATGKFWTQVPYGLDATTEMINYDQIREQAIKEKPAIIVAGYTAYPRRIDWAMMREIADAAEALLMVDMSHIAGLVAGEAYPSPFPYADIVTTTTHKTLRGPRSALIFVKKDARELDKKIDRAVFPGLQGGPHENQIAAVAITLKEATSPSFKKYADQVVKNASVLATELHARGWRLISGGTDSHLILIDTWNDGKKNEKGAGGVSGKDASDALEKAGIIVNKNAIPFDVRPPADPSGIRIGTAAETTRGRKEKDFKMIAKKIDEVLRKAGNKK